MRKFTTTLLIAACLGGGWTLGALADDEQPGAWPAPSAQAQAIGFNGGLTCVVYTNDWQRCVKWYQEVLGFQMQYEMAEMRWAELHSAVTNVTLGVGGRDDVPAEKGGNSSLVFGVADIDVARKTLESKGVEFDGPTTVIPDLVKLAYFKDPEGNQLSLYQSLQK